MGQAGGVDASLPSLAIHVRLSRIVIAQSRTADMLEIEKKCGRQA